MTVPEVIEHQGQEVGHGNSELVRGEGELMKLVAELPAKPSAGELAESAQRAALALLLGARLAEGREGLTHLTFDWRDSEEDVEGEVERQHAIEALKHAEQTLGSLRDAAVRLLRLVAAAENEGAGEMSPELEELVGVLKGHSPQLLRIFREAVKEYYHTGPRPVEQDQKRDDDEADGEDANTNGYAAEGEPMTLQLCARHGMSVDDVGESLFDIMVPKTLVGEIHSEIAEVAARWIRRCAGQQVAEIGSEAAEVVEK